ncbi:hypothetical protein P175DRAFT_0527773 [Aspergillus ochraceoroseus IBT 24754]|uniref:Uncharacterized protein n=1 Tax=Aspergillus ochraceoroseus IBT 24754 TaxID=1392256 RepID=A0A2T5M706_9EURO|nr:uncharacterized protein P175DRAFT_0527773 [Aspergillus ochraceoroseus IBT 24754]PTU24312.1 hypothetical protein P175DRAFT_0527773 [Aspergillus ochraceoroseus IBT 24754]
MLVTGLITCITGSVSAAHEANRFACGLGFFSGKRVCATVPVSSTVGLDLVFGIDAPFDGQKLTGVSILESVLWLSSTYHFVWSSCLLILVKLFDPQEGF